MVTRKARLRTGSSGTALVSLASNASSALTVTIDDRVRAEGMRMEILSQGATTDGYLFCSIQCRRTGDTRIMLQYHYKLPLLLPKFFKSVADL